MTQLALRPHDRLSLPSADGGLGRYPSGPSLAEPGTEGASQVALRVAPTCSPNVPPDGSRPGFPAGFPCPAFRGDLAGLFSPFSAGEDPTAPLALLPIRTGMLSTPPARGRNVEAGKGVPALQPLHQREGETQKQSQSSHHPSSTSPARRRNRRSHSALAMGPVHFTSARAKHKTSVWQFRLELRPGGSYRPLGLSRSGLGRRKSDPAAPVQSPCSIFDQAGRFPLGSEPFCGEHRPCPVLLPQLDFIHSQSERAGQDMVYRFERGIPCQPCQPIL